MYGPNEIQHKDKRRQDKYYQDMQKKGPIIDIANKRQRKQQYH